MPPPRIAERAERVNRPVRSAAGTWVVDGWSAWKALAGEHDTSGRWREVLRVGERLNAALADVDRPPFLASRTHAWAVGDRVAWGEQPPELVHERLRPLVDRLLTYMVADDSPRQVIHGDLTRNVLFARGLDPGVIDVTPYWRPRRFCLAIVVVDALLWHGAPPRILAALPQAEDRNSLLARAALYRLITSDRLAAGPGQSVPHGRLGTVVADHQRVLAALDRA